MGEVRIFDNPKNVRKIVWLFYTCLLVLGSIDLIIHRHFYFQVEGIPNFYAIFGFLACVTLVYIAKGLRKVVRRDEDYYD